MKKRKLLMTLALLSATVHGAWAFSGSGTQQNPYLIENENDWTNTFVSSTNTNSYQGEYWKLDADLTVSAMASENAGYPFKGHFDGGGHTVTLNISASSQKVGLFRYVDGATFTNLVLEGSVTNEDVYAASLVGDATGKTTISNCISKVTIKGQTNFDADHFNIGWNGGFVAHNGGKGTLTFTNCAFLGKLLLYVDEDTYYEQIDNVYSVGGFVGLTEADTKAVFNQCVFDCSEYSMNQGELTGSNQSFSCVVNGNCDNCLTLTEAYYVNQLGSGQGAPCYKSAPAEGLYSTFTYGSYTYYFDVVSTLEPFYLYTGNVIELGEFLKTAGGTQLTLGNDYTFTRFTHNGDDVTDVQEVGRYEITVQGTDACKGSQDYSLFVVRPLAGEGTTESPYIIANVDDWNTFAICVNNGFRADQCYKLADGWNDSDNGSTALSATIGTEAHPFTGTFDGNHQTLRVNISNTTEAGTAPFRYISGATIKDVTVTGDVTGTIHAAGLVGFAWAGTNTISGCTVSATVSVLTGDNQHVGGIVGHGKTSTLILDNCIFNGTIYHNKDYAGGLMGWCDGNKLTITNSFFLGTYGSSSAVASGFHPIALKTDNGKMTFSDHGAYYLAEAASTIDGSDSRVFMAGVPVTTTATEGASSVTAPNGNTYYYNKVYDLVTEINSADDWNRFVLSCLTETGAYSGKTVKLNADISVTTWMPQGNDRVFKGLFKGNKHTITVNYTTDADYCAPFYRIENATIRSLSITGTITTTGQRAAGFAAIATDNCNFDNCVSSVNIVGNRNGAAYHGGFVAKAESSTKATLTFETCVFNGTFTGTATHLGGFVGEATGQDADNALKTLFDDTLFFPSSGLGLSAATGSQTFVRLGSNASIDAHSVYYCYEQLGELQGKMVWAISPSNELTFNHGYTDETTVSKITLCPEREYFVYGDKLYAAAGDEVELRFTTSYHNATGEKLCNISVTDKNSAAVTTDIRQLIWYEDEVDKDYDNENIIVITMPASDVAVSPVYAAQPSGLFVNMPEDTKTLEISLNDNPVRVTSFKLYDDGGKNGNYSDYYDGTFKVHAPAGYVLQLSGTITTQNGADVLSVKGGSTYLLEGVSSSQSGETLIIPPLFTTDNQMTIQFKTNSDETYAGLDLTVTLVNTSDKHNIAIGTATGGTIATTDNKTEASTGETVLLTATPAEGYLLTDILVTDAFGKSYAVAGGQLWYAQTPDDAATFTMPPTAVTVTPVFTNVFTAEGGLYARLSKTSQYESVIPSYVKSFKIYDDGGKDGNYSNLCNGRICFKAPDACELQLSGSITTERTDDVLSTFDYNGEVMLSCVSSTLTGTPTAIPIKLSTSGGMEVWFSSSGSLNFAGLDLTMEVVHSDWADAAGTEADPHMIYTTAQLDLLAHRVNGTNGETQNSYSGHFFCLGNDIAYTATTDWNSAESTEDNYTAIGGTHAFQGTFDGKNHTISGLRISKADKMYQGLFGYVEGGKVKNVIVENSRITGSDRTGGIVGFSDHSTVTNCHVKKDVCIHTENGSVNYHGGIVGYNYGNNGASELSNCTSRATLTVKSGAGLGDSYGAIAGENYKSNIHDNLAINAVVPAAKGNKGGIIVGTNDQGTLANNYYTVCTFDGTANAADKGCHAGDVEESDGAVPALRDAADNSTALSLLKAHADVLGKCDIALNGRTLYKDGTWNTICLPFNYKLNAQDIRELRSSDFNSATGELTLNFSGVHVIKAFEAGKPYLVKWSLSDNLVNPVFQDVTINNVQPEEWDAGSGPVMSIGLYNPLDITGEDRTLLYLGAGNKLYYPNASMTIGAFRAYFKLADGLTASPNPSEGGGNAVRAFVLNFGDGETTGISLTPDPSPKGEGSEYYDMLGRRLSGKPTQSGLYISNRRKVYVK